MVIDYCTPNLQPCIIHFCVRSNTLIKMMYHTFLDIECTMSYDHICTLMLPAEFSICCVQASRLPDISNWNTHKKAKIEIFENKFLIDIVRLSPLFWCLLSLNFMNLILENLFLVKNSYLRYFDLGTSRVYTETKGKNHVWIATISPKKKPNGFESFFVLPWRKPYNLPR